MLIQLPTAVSATINLKLYFRTAVLKNLQQSSSSEMAYQVRGLNVIPFSGRTHAEVP
jgi:hypothetical protein